MNLLFITPPNIGLGKLESIVEGKKLTTRPGAFPPMGLGYLTAVAEKPENEIKVIDLNINPWPPEQEIRDFSPDLVLISSMTFQYHAAKLVAKKLNGRYPTIVGGAHSSVLKEKIMDDGFDIIGVQEGENTMRSLLEHFPDNLDKVPGIIYKKDNQVINTGDPVWAENLDDLPFPAWHHFELDKYDSVYYGRKCIPIMSTRGCPYTCHYCYQGVFGHQVRMRSAQNVIDEFLFFKEKYGIGAIQFQDDLFTLKKRRTVEFCQTVIDQKVDMVWRCLVRADDIDIELASLMKEAGCVAMAFGIESGSQEVLDKVGKKLKIAKVRKAIEATNKVGIVSKGYYMIGLPGDTHESIQETIDFAKKNKTHQIQFTLPVPFPGTELWEIGKKKGLPVEDHIESFGWDNSLPPYSFTDNLTAKEIESYVVTARLTHVSLRHRIYTKLQVAKLSEYPTMFKKGFFEIVAFLRILPKRISSKLKARVEKSEVDDACF